MYRIGTLGQYEAMIEVVHMTLIMAGGDGKAMQKVLECIEATIARQKFNKESETLEKFPIVAPSLLRAHPIPRTEASSLHGFKGTFIKCIHL